LTECLGIKERIETRDIGIGFRDQDSRVYVHHSPVAYFPGIWGKNRRILEQIRIQNSSSVCEQIFFFFFFGNLQMAGWKIMLKRMKVKKLTKSPFGVEMTKSCGFHIRQRHSSDFIAGRRNAF
jgi:hypothetical protein